TSQVAQFPASQPPAGSLPQTQPPVSQSSDGQPQYQIGQSPPNFNEPPSASPAYPGQSPVPAEPPQPPGEQGTPGATNASSSAGEVPPTYPEPGKPYGGVHTNPNLK